MKKVIFFFALAIFIHLTPSLAQAAECSGNQLTLWAQQMTDPNFVCQMTDDNRGAFILSKNTQGIGLKLGFYLLNAQGRISTQATDSTIQVGFQRIDLNLGTQRVKAAYRDINADGQKDFLFRATNPHSASFYAVSLDSRQKLTYVTFNFRGQGKAMVEYTQLVNSDTHPLIIGKNTIRYHITERNMGVTTARSLSVRLNRTSHKFVE